VQGDELVAVLQRDRAQHQASGFEEHPASVLRTPVR
jgi:hypothetical protein